jgi:4'-phosphopantetheinyl transferase
LTARVDVWFSSLDAQPTLLESLRTALSPDELERAARFHFARDRDRYIVGRGLLRALLAEQVQVEPAELRFDYTAYGKPRLRGHDAITFNVSHSASRAVFAIADGAQVGVDVEVLDSKPSDELVARQFFSAPEVGEFLSLPLATRPRAFLTTWTRKEAYIKARGEGLSLPLQDFDVTLLPGVPPELRRTAWSDTEPSEWRLYDISGACAGCIAALAVRAPAAEVSLGELELGAAGFERCRGAPSQTDSYLQETLPQRRVGRSEATD